MSRTEHIINRFQATLGESWWWRRYADLADRRNEDGTYKPFDYQAASRLMMTRRNRRKYAAQIAKGLPIEHRLPYRASPKNKMDAKVPMVERPEGMTRQTQRRLYREACKIAGVPATRRPPELSKIMKFMGYTKLPRYMRGMPEWQRLVEEDRLWAEASKAYISADLADLAKKL